MTTADASTQTMAAGNSTEKPPVTATPTAPIIAASARPTEFDRLKNAKSWPAERASGNAPIASNWPNVSIRPNANPPIRANSTMLTALDMVMGKANATVYSTQEMTDDTADPQCTHPPDRR